MVTDEKAAKKQRVQLPWGTAEVLDEITVEGTTSEPGAEVEVGVARLRHADGEELLRFFYRSSGRTRRGPLTLRASERAALRAQLARAPELRTLLRELVR
jgi:hypothetical protein